ncbi:MULTISPECIES: hypothetical protein [Muribaculum]|uniref:hypothetical protein n=1 Tax=Muribaculum TaxID=1918540 RepID=UPI00143D3D36|nr:MULTISPECIES: hypothetical protein [Muribaculum]MCX4277018.1 hypothetical protein [Muribaculum sp.]
MKKLFLLLFTFSCLYAVGQVSERATAGFEFPFKIGDAQWKSYSSAKERVAGTTDSGGQTEKPYDCGFAYCMS